MMKTGPRLPQLLMQELANADWHWEPGTKHWKLIVNGEMAGIWPQGQKGRNVTDRRPIINTRSQIRRILKHNA